MYPGFSRGRYSPFSIELDGSSVRFPLPDHHTAMMAGEAVGGRVWPDCRLVMIVSDAAEEGT